MGFFNGTDCVKKNAGYNPSRPTLTPAGPEKLPVLVRLLAPVTFLPFGIHRLCNFKTSGEKLALKGLEVWQRVVYIVNKIGPDKHALIRPTRIIVWNPADGNEKFPHRCDKRFYIFKK